MDDLVDWKPIPEPLDNEYQEVAWGLNKVFTKEYRFEPIVINRPKVGDYDVRFEMDYAGICHSDVHLGNGELGKQMFPMVPGHELLGTVLEVGSKVTKVKVGDTVGVGVISDSCLNCAMCNADEEQYCLNGENVHTYNDKKRHTHIGGNQETQTFGGYSGSNTIHEHFVLKIPDSLNKEKAAPIMCAGITVWDPLCYWGARNGGKTVGVVGIGGLGTMGLKLAKAMGNTVVALSSSDSKKDTVKSMGIDHYVNHNNSEDMAKWAKKIDLILDTVSADHGIEKFMQLLNRNATHVLLGLVTNLKMNCLTLIPNRQSIAGSKIGGIKATQDLLEFCGEHQIYPDTVTVTADKISECWDQLLANSAQNTRFVINIKKSKENKDFCACCPK